MQANVGTIERWSSLLGGGALLAYAVRRGWRSPRSAAASAMAATLGIGAAALLFRGATGHCPVFAALGIDTTRATEATSATGETIRRGGRTWPLPEGARRIRPEESLDDVVDEASRESFPASDPPAY